MGNQDTGSKICRSLFGIPPSTGRIETGMGNSGTIIRIMISSAQNNGELDFCCLGVSIRMWSLAVYGGKEERCS